MRCYALLLQLYALLFAKICVALRMVPPNFWTGKKPLIEHPGGSPNVHENLRAIFMYVVLFHAKSDPQGGSSPEFMDEKKTSKTNDGCEAVITSVIGFE